MLISHEVPKCLFERSLDFNDYDYALVHLFDKILTLIGDILFGFLKYIFSIFPLIFEFKKTTLPFLFYLVYRWLSFRTQCLSPPVDPSKNEVEPLNFF